MREDKGNTCALAAGVAAWAEGRKKRASPGRRDGQEERMGRWRCEPGEGVEQGRHGGRGENPGAGACEEKERTAGMGPGGWGLVGWLVGRTAVVDGGDALAVARRWFAEGQGEEGE